MYSTREEIKSWLEEMYITSYVINKDLTIDVDRSVNIFNKNLKEIPVKFGKVNGNFNCSHNELTSLEGCPDEVIGHFYCYNNRLTSLKGCPLKVNNGFFCHENELTSLKGCPIKVNGNFYCHNNNLTSLEGWPREVNSEYINIEKNNFIEKELLNFNCNIENVIEVYSDFNEDGNVEEFLEKVHFYKVKKENDLLKELSINGNNIKLNKKL